MEFGRHDGTRSGTPSFSTNWRLPLTGLSLCAALSIALPDLYACSFWEPEHILTSRQVILRTPVGDFAQEVLTLTAEDGAPALPEGLVRLPPRGRGESVPEPSGNELAELRDDLDRRGVPADQKEKIVAAYGDFRAALQRGRPLKSPPAESDGDSPDPNLRFDERVRVIRQLAVQPAPVHLYLPTVLSEGLPGEWTDYLEGAVCFWGDDLSGARAAWERLLARPQSERLYCSIRAAYMLARVLDEPSAPADENSSRYRRVRALRAAGCRDAFNLASASLGWEARDALDRKDCSTAVRLYYLQGVTSGIDLEHIGASLEAVVAGAAGDHPDPAALSAAARDPFLRRVITLSLACSRSFATDDSQLVWSPGVTPAPVAAAADKSADSLMEEGWLAALNQAQVNGVQEAAAIAWAAYQQGDYPQAVGWLGRAPAEDGLALWLRAKLALRAGKSVAAAAFFARAVHCYPAEIKEVSNLDDAWVTDGRAFRTSQFQTDLGIISLARGDYAQALAALLRSGFWRDAAYVAERVMTVEELLAFVRTNFPEAPSEPSLSKEDAANALPVPGKPLDIMWNRTTINASANPAAYATRYLLARRLARVGRYAEARQYYDAPLLPKFDEYVAARKLGESPRQSAAARAEALWRAAKIERWLGMELFGSEDDPDWLVDEGAFQEDVYRASRLDLPQPRDLSQEAQQPGTPAPAPSPSPPFVPPVSKDEKRRLAENQIKPEKRYHYRYLAANLAWRAAALMPDKQEQTAVVLATAGRWLESVDATKAADKFYLAILRRCGQTDIGREADKTGVIPEVPDQDF